MFGTLKGFASARWGVPGFDQGHPFGFAKSVDTVTVSGWGLAFTTATATEGLDGTSTTSLLGTGANSASASGL